MVDWSDIWDRISTIWSASFDKIGCFTLLLLPIFTAITLIPYVFVFLVIIPFGAVSIHNYNKKVKEDYQNALITAERDLVQAQKEYRVEQDKRNAYCEELRKQIAKLNEGISSLKIKLSDMYKIGSIYAPFQNIEAITQIYDYVASGVCDTLEGSNGAYAQYMLDVRANRICASISEFKQAMVQEFSRIQKNQYSLYLEMKKTNEILNRIEASVQYVNEHMNRIEQETISAAKYLQIASDRLVQIEQGVNLTSVNSAVNAMNQYRIACDQGVSAYKLQYPA